MIIGIVGKKRSGKDTVALYLVKEHGFVQYSLANPIKRACKDIFLFSDEQLWGDKKEEIDLRYNTTPRKILQIFGTELFQFNIYDHIPEMLKAIKPREIWINRFKLWYLEELKKRNDKNIVISDVRFPHEVKILKKLGGIIIKVVRNGLKENDDHASETEMDKIIDIDYVIKNDLSIKDLQLKVDFQLKKWRCYKK